MTENLEIIHKLTQTIRNNSAGNSRYTIELAGAGCIGKSTLSGRLMGELGLEKCQIVELDSYMLPRSRAGDLTGYNPKRFEIRKAVEEVGRLIHKGTPYDSALYNRLTHKRDITVHISPKSIILIEGGLALRRDFQDFGEMKIFLDANEDTQFKLRLKREQQEFGYSEEQVRQRFQRYYPDYLTYIQPTRENATIILSTDINYNLEIVAMK